MTVTTHPGLTCLFENDPRAVTEGVLAVISHAYSSEAPTLQQGRPTLGISVPQTRQPGQVEIWRTGDAVVSGKQDGLVYAHDGNYLFCGGMVRHDADYAVAVEGMYQRIFSLLERMGFPEVARVWNIVGGITALVDGQRGLDRYGAFCQARARAFAHRGLVTREMPAATGIGGQDAFTSVYLLATRHRDIIRIENPRQVPAYEYPDQYGPQPPSFARAAYVQAPAGSGDLFISGTASIVGHQTVHHGDIELQTRTTLENIAELVSGENLRRHGVDADVHLRDLDCLKVYVKHPTDLESVRRICASVLGPRSRVLYTIADVCRPDLLVEIEGFASIPHR